MNFEIKIIRPLAQFKNLKFLRLVYPLRRFQIQSKPVEVKFKKTLRKLSIKAKKKKKVIKNNNHNINKKEEPKSIISLRKRYILMGNRTKRFTKKSIIKLSIRKNKSKFRLSFAKVITKKFKLRVQTKKYKLKMIIKKKAKIKNKKKKKINKKNTYVFKKSANFFQRLRRQELLNFTQSRLGSVRRKLIIRSFVPIASLFIKYLNPQILADHIAKEFEKTKHHKHIIYGLSQALRALPFARAKDYRIAIVGRINSSDKSRSYLFKRNVLIRQDFSRKVNFASSQAKARIGSFGIKV